MLFAAVLLMASCFVFGCLHCDKLEKCATTIDVSFLYLFSVNANAKNQSGGMWMPHTGQQVVGFCFWFYDRENAKSTGSWLLDKGLNQRECGRPSSL